MSNDSGEESEMPGAARSRHSCLGEEYLTKFFAQIKKLTRHMAKQYPASQLDPMEDFDDVLQKISLSIFAVFTRADTRLDEVVRRIVPESSRQAMVREQFDQIYWLAMTPVGGDLPVFIRKIIEWRVKDQAIRAATRNLREVPVAAFVSQDDLASFVEDYFFVSGEAASMEKAFAIRDSVVRAFAKLSKRYQDVLAGKTRHASPEAARRSRCRARHKLADRVMQEMLA